jgi:hydrogenase expression/formation protein HypE
MKSDVILLGHGSGGKLSHDLLDNLIVPTLSGIGQRDQNDAAVLAAPNGRLAFTTDSYVVDPIFFPGGNIGDLAIHGTVNDLAMAGATPLAISVGLIIEEGLSIEDLRRVLESMRDAAQQAEVKIVTGDTKVVPRGKADKLFINTSGIGVIEHDLQISGINARVGDKILVNGTIGDHGMAVLASREGLELESNITTDSAPLNSMVAELVAKLGSQLHTLRDPTRGGLAATLNEIAWQSGAGMHLLEDQIPIRPDVNAACELLGLDPLYVANEGKLIAICPEVKAQELLETMQAHPLGCDAAIIGKVVEDEHRFVTMETGFGGNRIVDWIAGEQLPRIC